MSMHCVRGYGHLLETFQRLTPERCPTAIMLHSYGGSIDMVSAFTRIPKGIGSRISFSFSDVINGRNREQLIARIQAVPADRLLIESDQNTALAVDDGLKRIVSTVSEAREWGEQETRERTYDNFLRFFESSLGKMSEY